MENMKSLADQLREELGKPGTKKTKKVERNKHGPEMPQILQAIINYDNSNNKSMVHVRFDADYALLLSQFKIATNIDTTKVVAFAVRYLFEQHPELKKVIKQFMLNTEL
ncbi:hypothetical protein SAMN05192574_105298 [Mucilaginibacter gossypiicola]|uniref:Uncharacterized protein n=1 Tax=Mucilaginibacter gossypiicola TaxID=551995 RepID=A0A1H8LXY4_9SPHI|nr:hypothetical protein [Mucilaginibacter gossypiicola]SEO09949.1 hypothetical protein SAMN05192574_105298 [Mucilaginibacter gossypiicola]